MRVEIPRQASGVSVFGEVSPEVESMSAQAHGKRRMGGGLMNTGITRATVLVLAGGRGQKIHAADIDVFADAVREVYPRLAYYFMDRLKDPDLRFEAARDILFTVRRGGLVILDSWEDSLPSCIVV